MSSIRDPGLADDVSDAEQSRWRTTLAISTAVGEHVAMLDLRGMRVECFQHVLLDSALIVLPLLRAGAQVRMAAVNPDSTNDTAAAFLARAGAEVWAWTGMSEADRREGLDWLVSEPVEAISDMGGEANEAATLRGMRPRGVLEATMSGSTASGASTLRSRSTVGTAPR